MELYVTSVTEFDPIRAGLEMIALAKAQNGTAFEWLGSRRIDRHMGNNSTSLALDAQIPVAEIVESWQPRLGEFKRLRNDFLLYGSVSETSGSESASNSLGIGAIAGIAVGSVAAAGIATTYFVSKSKQASSSKNAYDQM